MTNIFNLKIITPEKTIFADEINMAMIPSYEGDMSILKDHISIITFLRPGIIKTNNSKESSKSFFVTDGIVEFSENNLVILSTSAINAKELKKDYINSIEKDSYEKLKQQDLSDEERYILNYKIDTIKTLNL